MNISRLIVISGIVLHVCLADHSRVHAAYSSDSSQAFVTESANADKKTDIAVKELIAWGEYYYSRDPDRAIEYLLQALAAATALSSQDDLAESLFFLGRSYYYKDDYEKSRNYLSGSRRIWESLNSADGLARYHHASGSIYHINGSYLKATEDFQEAVRLSRKSGNILMESVGLLSLGALSLQRNDYVSGREFLDQSRRLVRSINDDSGLANVLANIGQLHQALGQYDSAYAYLHEALGIRRALHEERGIASSEYTLGNLLIEMSKPHEALQQLESSLNGFSRLGDDMGIGLNQIKIARAHGMLGSYAEALHAGNTALEISRLIDNPWLASESHLALAEIFRMQSNYRDALMHLESSIYITDSLSEVNKERLISELEYQFQSERKDDEISLLRSRAQLQSKNNVLLLVSLIALLLLLTLVLVLFRMKILALKKQRLIFEKEKTIHTQQAELIEKEKLLLQEQLDSKSRELATKALEMVRSTETIQNIAALLEVIRKKNTADTGLAKELKNAISLLERQQKDSSWHELEKIFKNIHPRFFEKLIRHCPDLSPAEIKVAAFLKMNLSTKEIAALTYKTEAGIKSCRFRLRRKLGLQFDDGLVPFLMQL